MRWRRKLGSLLPASLIALVAVPGIASAGTVADITGQKFHLRADDLSAADPNHVQLSYVQTNFGPDIVIEDPDGVTPEDPFDGCIPFSPTNLHCPAAGIGKLTVFLGAGNDELRARGLDFPSQAVILYLLAAGRDRLRGGPDDETVRGGGGRDTLHRGGGDDRAFGDAGNDVLQPSAGNDFESGGPGNDLIGGGAGNDTLNGGGGRDRLTGGAGPRDRCTGGQGRDLGGIGCETRRRF